MLESIGQQKNYVQYIDRMDYIAMRGELMIEYVTVPVWNRLEPRPRSEDFQRSLKAEVRDALWMLTRQWQMGEFIGDDAGTPVFSDIEYECAALTHSRISGANYEEINGMLPLEPLIEKQPLNFARKGRVLSFDIRVQMGNYWSKLLTAKGLKNLADKFLDKYPLDLPNIEANKNVKAHQDVWQAFALLNKRAIDGYELLISLQESFDEVLNKTGTATYKTELHELLIKFETWYKRVYQQPEPGRNNWQKSNLEYQAEIKFGLTSDDNIPNVEKELACKEYAGGHLDWHNFNIHVPDEPSDQFKVNSNVTSKTFLPSPVKFNGMPDARYWTIEEGTTNFAAIDVSALDIAELCLIDFALTYSNDWSFVPIKVPVGSVIDMKLLTVTDSFGNKTIISSANRGADDNWDKWAFFNLNKSGTGPSQKSDNNLFMPPCIYKAQRGKPLEEVVFIRDEMANIVWGIETMVTLANGKSKTGREHANALNSQQDPDNSEASPAQNGLHYVEMTLVPPNWIPFIPVRKDESSRQIQLQRGTMLDVANKPMDPHTSLLRGFDDSLYQPYYIYEEEIPRSGIKLSKSFKRTRWTNGEVFVWIGIQKQTGRGEGSSNLAFDQLGVTDSE